MTDDHDVRDRPEEALMRQRRFSVLFTAYVLGSLALIAVWGLTGDGYFWPGWPMLAGAVAFLALGLARGWSNRSFSDVALRAREAHASGRAPSGIQR